MPKQTRSSTMGGFEGPMGHAQGPGQGAAGGEVASACFRRCVLLYTVKVWV